MDKCTHEVRKQHWKNIINRKRLISGWIPSIHGFSYNDW